MLLLIKRAPSLTSTSTNTARPTRSVGQSNQDLLYIPLFISRWVFPIYIRCLKIHGFASRSCKRNFKSCEPSFTAAAPKMASLQPRPDNISPTPYYLQQKNWLRKLFTACKLELPGWMNQLNIRNIFTSSATPSLPWEVITAERNPPERTNYISAPTD